MSGLGLIPDTPPAKENKLDQELTAKLYNTLKANRLLPAIRVNTKGWPKEFSTLRKLVDDEEIIQTLEWFTHHLKDEYTPQVRSARAFREKFPGISAAMRRSSPELPKHIQPGAEITDTAIHIKQELDLDWPGEEGRSELNFIQLNLNYFSSFKNRLNILYSNMCQEADIADKKKLSTDNRRLLLRVIHLKHCCPSARELTAWWVQHVNEVAWKWPSWSGNLLAWVMHDQHNALHRQMARIIAEEFGDGSSWSLVKERLFRIPLEENKK